MHMKEQAELLVSAMQELVEQAAQIRDDLRQGPAALEGLAEKIGRRSVLFAAVQGQWEALSETEQKQVNALTGEAMTELLQQLTCIDREAEALVENLRHTVFNQAQLAKAQRLAQQEYGYATRGTGSLGFFIDKKNT